MLFIEYPDLSVPCSILSTGYRIFFSLGLTWSGHEVDHSPTSSAKVTNIWSRTSILPPSSLRSAQ
jgi:hypothetical protein